MPAAMRELVPAYPWVTRGQRYRPVWWDYGQPITPEIKRGLRRMLSDDAVKPALLTKLFSVSALDWSFTAAVPDSARSRNISDFMLYAARHMDGGTRALVEEVCLAGLVDGLSICEVVWRDEPEAYAPWKGKFCPKCVKAKEHAYPEYDAYGNITGIYAQTQNGFQSLPPDRFLIFTYLPLFGRPHSDLQAAYQIYTARVILMELWQYGLEKFGQPFAEGVYAPGDTVARDELIAHMEGLKSRTWVVHPDGTRINWVESAFKGEASYQACWEKLTEAIYLSINGAFLQSITSGAGGQRSMRGNSQTQKSTFELFVWHLASVIADVTNEKLWPAVTARNFVGAAPPTAALGGVNDADLKASAELDDILVNKLGLKLSIKERGHFYGRQIAEDEEDTLPGAAPKPSPFGGGEPGADGSVPGGPPDEGMPGAAE